MQITFKLYAQLGAYLPANAVQNEIVLDVAEGTTVLQLLDRFNVPRDKCHLVLVNGVHQMPAVRAHKVLQPGDHLAAWPPVAGG